uniref:Uncharacterized protein n=1 Tax=Thermocrispum agreste TaxID=37925 RepID=A0A2W4LF58_9PSEU|nr:MAG: hypothetical protein DIU77_14530 [Thermocrispum agreste]
MGGGGIRVETSEIADICEEFEDLLGAVETAKLKLAEVKYGDKSFAHIAMSSHSALTATRNALEEVEESMKDATGFIKQYVGAVRNALRIHTGSDKAASDDARAVEKDV